MTPRGQGTVELALGAVGLVSTLLLSIYLAEVGFLSLKVQEAGNFAALDGTGKRVHDFATPMVGNTHQPLAGVTPALAAAASARYRDFDGTTAAGGPSVVAQVFTRADNLSVACEQTGAAGPRFPFPRRGGPTGAQLRSWYQNRGGVACGAQARLSAFRLPRSYLDGAGGLQEEQLQNFAPMTVCSAGRAVSGTCRGRYALLLGDWSLDGPLNSDLSADHPFARGRDNSYPTYDNTPAYKTAFDPRNTNQPRNSPYRRMARELFVLSGAPYYAGQPGTSSSIAFADAMEPMRRFNTREALYNERQPDQSTGFGEDFAFSYAGPERGSQDVFETTCPPCHFNTNGTAPVDGPLGTRPLKVTTRWMDLRNDCFLGIDCR